VGALENLRYLVSNSDASANSAVGLAGGFQLATRLTSAGSPISNMCEEVGLEPLDEADVRGLVQFNKNAAGEDIAREAWLLAGGHPFLVQALLVEVERKGWPLDIADRAHLSSVLEPHIRRWATDIGSDGTNTTVVANDGRGRAQ